MRQGNVMKSAAVSCCLFAAISMSALLYFSANKIIAVADVAQDEVVKQQESDKAVVGDENAITLDRGRHNTNYLCIPMPANVKAEDVTIENHYMDAELWVSIRTGDMKNAEDVFYEDNSVYGNCDNVRTGHFEVEQDHIYLKFALTNVFEYKTIFEDDILYVEFVAPKEVYDRIVVIDAAYGAEEYGVAANGAFGKDITLNIARSLKEKLDATDIKIYYTRMDDSNPAERRRFNLAGATKADMLIRIEIGASENTKVYGTEAVYNSRFFIPRFGSVELADLLEREVVTAISGKAGGLVEATEEDGVILNATVPAAAVRVGYLTNGQESKLLQREDYIDKISNGIYNAIIKAYEIQE